MKVFAEMGIGNDAFFSTEFENDDTEHRIPKFVLPKKINEAYFRFWLFKLVLIISSRDGFKIKKKDRSKLKVLFGIGGKS